MRPAGERPAFLSPHWPFLVLQAEDQDKWACVFSQPLSEHPLDLSPSRLHLSLSFLERLAELSDENAARPPDRAGRNVPRPRQVQVLSSCWKPFPGLKPTLLRGPV